MQTVGEILRSEREKKGISIKDVEAATSIRALYINAIEESDYKIVPGEVYLKGFIRNYANFLGLNGPGMVDLYRQQQTASQSNAIPEAAASTTASVPSSKPDTTGEGTGSAKWIIGGIAIAAIAGVLWWVNARPANPAVPAPQPSAQVQPATPAPVIPAKPVPNPVPQAQPIQIIAKFSGECWTQVIADGKEIFEGIPRSGDSLTWNANNNMTIKFGNAGSVEANYNGQPLGKLGGVGEVVVKTFTANPQKQ